VITAHPCDRIFGKHRSPFRDMNRMTWAPALHSLYVM
jgi:hypothetical protein